MKSNVYQAEQRTDHQPRQPVGPGTGHVAIDLTSMELRGGLDIQVIAELLFLCGLGQQRGLHCQPGWLPCSLSRTGIPPIYIDTSEASSCQSCSGN